jgi:hypothetical protein
MDPRQQTAAFPCAIVVVDAGPRWQILWHISPLATRFVDVKNPVEDFQVRVLSGSAKGRGFGETVGNEVPFGRGEIGCISHPSVNRGKRILVQLQNARFIIIQSRSHFLNRLLDRPKVMYQVCRRLGYDDGWAQAFTPVEGHLGDVALSIMCSDLLYPGNNPKKHARTVKELHECFSAFLPGELGKLEDELELWKDEL